MYGSVNKIRQRHIINEIFFWMLVAVVLVGSGVVSYCKYL